MFLYFKLRFSYELEYWNEAASCDLVCGYD